MSSDPEWHVQIQQIESIRAAFTHSLSETPEEDAWKKIGSWAKIKGLHKKSAGTRLFGRNTYPTDDPEPHGYQLFLTIYQTVEPGEGIEFDEIPGGTTATRGDRTKNR